MKTINPNDDRPRGQVGIGTLIIFIAMVLVAAVAAGVLVNTSGLLQSKAEDTGSDAQAQVSNQIDVVSATGQVDSTNGDIDTVTMVVKKSPGSDPIDLSAATIEYTSDSESKTLTYAGTPSANEFSTTLEKGDSATVLDDSGERVKITIDASSIESSPAGIEPGEEVTLRVVDQSGATTVYGVNVPDVLTGQSYVRV
jgi:flagellin-like protein